MKNECEICLNIFHVDNHHIQSVSKDGSNKKWNKIKICPDCHRLVHIGEIIIEGKFLTSSGYKLLWRRKDSESITENKPEVYIQGEHK